MVLRFVFLALLAACSGDPQRSSTAVSSERSVTQPRPANDLSARYRLRFGGADIGVAEISLKQKPGGYRYRRDDRLLVFRDDQRLESTNSIVIDTDEQLRATDVRILSSVGDISRDSVANRDAGGWAIRDNRGQLRRVSGLPLAELAFIRGALGNEASDNVNSGPALLAGASFATVDLVVTPSASSRLDVSIGSALGSAHYTVIVGEDGLPNRWSSDVGETGERQRGIAPDNVYAAAPQNLLAIASMPSRGRRSGRLRVRSAERAAPPTIAGQAVRLEGTDWIIDFDRKRSAVPTELAALVVAIDQRIDNDLSAPGLSAKEALQMGRGDCTGHATALAQVAQASGYEVQIATGYRRLGRTWLRHRWMIARVGNRWVSLDPSFGEAMPSRSRLLVLTTHAPTSSEIALADLLTFAGMTAATAHFE